MAVGQLRPMLGRHLLCTITPQDVANDGTWTDNAAGAFSFAGRIKENGISNQTAVARFMPMDAPQETKAVLGTESIIYTITEIRQALPSVSGANKGYGYGNVLRYVRGLSYYHKLVLTTYNEAGTLLNTETVYVVMMSDEMSQSRDSNDHSMTFEIQDMFNTSTGARVTNPTYS